MKTVNKIKIIMVHSYKGGTGKSAIAINLARYLAIKQNKKVLLVEQDTTGGTFTKVFNIDPTKAWNDFYTLSLSLKDLIVKMGKFDVICARTQEVEIPTGINIKTFYARQLERLSLQKKWLKTNYEFVIFDTRPGYTFELVNSILVSDVAILTTRLDTDAIEKTINMYDKVYSQFKNKRIILVQNQVPTPVEGLSDLKTNVDVEKTLKAWEEFVKDKELFAIPLRNEIAYTLSRSKIVPLDNLFMTYIQQIANSVVKD